MENLDKLKKFWKKRKVLVTGHTGFKGSWLLLFLQYFKADIYGLSLPLSSNNLAFKSFKKNLNLKSYYLNIKNYQKVSQVIKKINPEIVFHLAAQPIVSSSYLDTRDTYLTNTIGTLNILDSLKNNKKIKSIVNITSDKSYYNAENKTFFKEDDKLCGTDPYSNSKSCSELISYSYYNSFFKKKEIGLATARAGNVLGGGDWAKDRLIVDLVKNIFKDEKFILRNPDSIRPWQYIIDLSYGYLLLAEKLYNHPEKFSSGWNFAPKNKNHITVNQLVKKFNKFEKDIKINVTKKSFGESKYLFLDNKKTSLKLEWTSKTNINDIVKETYDWYQNFFLGNDMHSYSLKLIENFFIND